MRRFLIQYIGNDANGLCSLYMSIIGFLTVAELGVGEAITFCMYKPIVEQDSDKVAALYYLFKKLYMIIGGVILFGGIVLMPFLPSLAKDYSELNVNVFFTFGLTLISVVLTYAYSAKVSLIGAYKYNYITTAIVSTGTLIEDVLKIAVVIVTRSLEGYLVCRIISVIIQWIAVDLICDRKFAVIIAIKDSSLDNESKKQIVDNIKAMFMHKIGSVLVNTADSVIISAFVGVIALGFYSNYTTIMVSLTGVLGLFFSPLTSVVGHAFVSESKEYMNKTFNAFYGFNYALGVVFCLGYYAVIDNVVLFCFGKNLDVDRTVVFVITLNYFIQFMRTSTLMFRASTGTFYYDRYKPVAEGIVNAILSVALVKTIGIAGVIIATIFTSLLICDTIEPYVLYKHALKKKVTPFYIMNYSYIAIFAICTFVVQKLMISNDSVWMEFYVNGIISVAVSVIPLSILWITNRYFREMSMAVVKKAMLKVKRH